MESLDPYTEDDDMWGGAPEILHQGGRDIPIIRSEVTIIPYRRVLSQSDQKDEAVNLRSGIPNDNETYSWYIWNWLDNVIQYIIVSVDRQAGVGRGQQVMKVILLCSPIVIGVIASAMWVIKGDDRESISYTKSI